MLLPQILLLATLSLLLRFLTQRAGSAARGWVIFATSVVALFWLQPAMPVRSLDFWLPVVTLALAGLGWLLTAPVDLRNSRENWFTAGVVIVLVLLVALTRYVGGGAWLIATRPPPPEIVLPGLLVVVGIWLAVGFTLRARLLAGWALGALIALLIALLVWLKTPALALEAGRELRVLMGQNPALATAIDIRWLGFSYICFRLIHTLRDRQLGKLSGADLQTYISYVVFFPALVAGPIDRLERFARDLRPAVVTIKKATDSGGEPRPRPSGALGFIAQPAFPWIFSVDPAFSDDLIEAAKRLTLGLFKKFALADSLALIALNPVNALQVREPGWLWLLVYLYAFQIYLDFSGYTDIAIGLGRLFGIKLPENFNAPYRKPNLTQFWNAWHMTLTQWFRAYFFNPFVRWLRVPARRVSPVTVLLISQLCTMLLIGLWHGMTLSFVLWGLWHGLGLFLQNRWTELTRAWFAARSIPPVLRCGMHIFSILLTFHFVALGWVWFVLPEPGQAWVVLLRLFGGGY